MIDDWIPSTWVAPGSVLTLCVSFTLLVVRGYLVPPRLVHRDEYDRVKRERDEAMELSRELLEQNRQLITGSQVVVDVLQALPTQPADRDR